MPKINNFCLFSLNCTNEVGYTIVWIKMNNTVKWPFFRPFLAFFCKVYGQLSKNWGSDSHFEVLKGSTPWCLRCRWKPCTCLANSQKIATDKWPFTTISGHFFANCMFIFHKTEVQMVILKCLKSLNPNWFTSYDTKRKNARNADKCFLYKIAKNWKWKYLLFVS